MTITLAQLKSALVSTVLVAVMAIIGYITGVGDIFSLDWKVLINIGVMALLAGLASVIKNLLTTDSGNFAGVLNIK